MESTKKSYECVVSTLITIGPCGLAKPSKAMPLWGTVISWNPKASEAVVNTADSGIRGVDFFHQCIPEYVAIQLKSAKICGEPINMWPSARRILMPGNINMWHDM